ncbi:MAG: inorganic phosphate transporter, partial [Bacteroidetes bacterium]|nr:inorganic phosphate transporter [Bacteroidota bacterium]
AIGLGTLLGGWKVVGTMGVKLTHLKPVHGFCAEGAGAFMLLGTAIAGIPVSTTHTITGSIMGVGATRRLSAVRWGVVNNIVIVWILTIPTSAAIGAFSFWIVELFR